MITEKKFKKEHAERIIGIYEKFDIPFIPRLVESKLTGNDCFLSFEWIDGDKAAEADVPDVYRALGKMHLLCKQGIYDNGFETICHGDFHLGNILKTAGGIRFVDVTYLHKEWNFSDFDYMDFYDLYDPVEFPWMTHNKECLPAYLDAIGQKLSPAENESLIKSIMVFSLKNNIRNGIANNIDVAVEEKYLKEIVG